jgi:hypothetical protein
VKKPRRIVVGEGGEEVVVDEDGDMEGVAPDMEDAEEEDDYTAMYGNQDDDEGEGDSLDSGGDDEAVF